MRKDHTKCRVKFKPLVCFEHASCVHTSCVHTSCVCNSCVQISLLYLLCIGVRVRVKVRVRSLGHTSCVFTCAPRAATLLECSRGGPHELIN